jgi:F-type H+-transporting ATPase subunit b
MSVRNWFYALLATALLPAMAFASAGHGEGGSSDPQRDLALWTTAVFICLVLILWKFAWKPIAAALDKREKGIADQIAQADAANAEAKRLLDEHERKLADAALEVRGIVDQGRRDAEKLGQELLEKTRAEAAAEQTRAKQEIEAAADAAVQGLADQSARMAVELAGKIVGTKLNPKDHARLIDQAVGEFSQN